MRKAINFVNHDTAHKHTWEQGYRRKNGALFRYHVCKEHKPWFTRCYEMKIESATALNGPNEAFDAGIPQQLAIIEAGAHA